LDCHAELISRLKILAGLRTDEHIVPQDGRCVISQTEAEELAVRVSIMPTHFGENAVLRLLPPIKQGAALPELGMTALQENLVLRALSRMQGMVLVSGATGSGKTTTLYALMRLLSKDAHSLITIEDPVEYTLPDIPQIQVLPHAGLTFSKGLRSVLRQDPDVIMVGEIRDEETAQLAFTAALTGHLVLSTVHASGAQAVRARLHDLGLRDSLVDSSLRISLSQRLLRTNCRACAIEIPLTRQEQLTLLRRFDEEEVTSATHYTGVGCAVCAGTGFSGRTALFDILHQEGSVGQARSRHALLEKVLSGEVRLSELIRSEHA
jgi:type II secretory ATPase GspE/PulE/Tfp pilus assembly ATPase PilB-like protein